MAGGVSLASPPSCRTSNTPLLEGNATSPEGKTHGAALSFEVSWISDKMENWITRPTASGVSVDCEYPRSGANARSIHAEFSSKIPVSVANQRPDWRS